MKTHVCWVEQTLITRKKIMGMGYILINILKIDLHKKKKEYSVIECVNNKRNTGTNRQQFSSYYIEQINMMFCH